MHMFWGCYWNFPFLIKEVSSWRIVLRKWKCFPIRFQCKKKQKKTWISPSPGAILTISLRDMFGPSTLYLTVGKDGDYLFNSLSLNLLFNSLSLNLLLPSITSSLSVWSLLLDSLAFLSVFLSVLLSVWSFYNSGSDCTKIFWILVI